MQGIRNRKTIWRMMRNIDEFGSMENVRDKATPRGEILSHLIRPKDERGYELSDTGVFDRFFQEVADGFCS